MVVVQEKSGRRSGRSISLAQDAYLLLMVPRELLRFAEPVLRSPRWVLLRLALWLRLWLLLLRTLSFMIGPFASDPKSLGHGSKTLRSAGRTTIRRQSRSLRQ
jgi:hypothetical protein